MMKGPVMAGVVIMTFLFLLQTSHVTCQAETQAPELCSCLIFGCGPFSFCSIPRCSCQACFHGDSHVTTPTGVTTLRHLHAGDEVLVVDESGRVKYEPVLFHAHSDPHMETLFIQITTHTNHTLTLTPSHYVYKGLNTATAELSEASSIQAGDRLLVLSERGDLDQTRVRAVSRVWRRSVFSPVTPSGSMLVDGVHCSVYASDIPPLTPRHSHLLLWPVRLVFTLYRSGAAWIIEHTRHGQMPAVLYWLDVVRDKYHGSV